MTYPGERSSFFAYLFTSHIEYELPSVVLTTHDLGVRSAPAAVFDAISFHPPLTFTKSPALTSVTLRAFGPVIG